MSISYKQTHRAARYIKLASACVLAALLAACGGSSSTIASAPAKPAVNDLGLWVANGTNVLEYIPSQLTGGTVDATPHLVNSSASFGAPQGVTFDAQGNLWVLDPQAMVNGAATPALLKFSATQLHALGTSDAPVPTATITSATLNFPQQSVFDAMGNQWVTDHNNNTVLVFSSAQLAESGINNLTPVLSISSTAFNGPLGIVFDAQGNLWIANNGGVTSNAGTSPSGTTIVKFSAQSLPAISGGSSTMVNLTPTTILSDDGNGSMQAPWALIFDSNGNLLSSNANAPFTLVQFSPSQLAASSMPTPSVTISPTTSGTPSLNSPNGICFDNIGDMAAMNSAGAFGIAFYTKSQIATGAVVPNTFIVGANTTLNAPAGCNFGPLIQ